jgi:hypothetical protein
MSRAVNCRCDLSRVFIVKLYNVLYSFSFIFVTLRQYVMILLPYMLTSLPQGIVRVVKCRCHGDITCCHGDVTCLRRRASQVCKQWRRISTTAALWKRAALSGLTLTDNWSLFKERFSGLARIDTRGGWLVSSQYPLLTVPYIWEGGWVERCTDWEVLHSRPRPHMTWCYYRPGMIFSTHINKVWEALAPALGSLPTLKFITLGTATSPVVPVLLNSIKGVKHFEVGNCNGTDFITVPELY